MLNDKEFEEIGKRLYDLEDDPPRGGWEKIASELADDNPETPPFMWKNGWKLIPLLFIAALTYWLWPKSVPVNDLASSADTGIELLQNDQGVSTENAITKADADSIRSIPQKNEGPHILTEQPETKRIARSHISQSVGTVSENSTRSEDGAAIRSDILSDILNELNRGVNLESAGNKETEPSDENGLFVNSLSLTQEGNHINSDNELNEITEKNEKAETVSSGDAVHLAVQETLRSQVEVIKSEEDVSEIKSKALELDSKTANLIEVAEGSNDKEPKPVIANTPSSAAARDEAKIGYGSWRISIAAIPQF